MSRITKALTLALLLNLACTNKKTEVKRTTENVGQEQTSSDGQDGDSGQDSQNYPSISGEEFFKIAVVPAFNQCKRCHAGPEIPVETSRGPITIFEHRSMLTMLDANTLLPMLRNQNPERPHPNNDPCLAGLNSSPCKEVAEWWDVEFKDQAEKASDRPLTTIGEIRFVSPDGQVEGWAVDPKNLGSTVSVNIYIGETLLQSVEANEDIYDNDNDGPHGFSLSLGEAYKNGQNFQLKAKSLISGQEMELASSPYDFAALPKTVQGRTYFDDNLDNLIKANCGCHGNSLSYDYSWIRLATPLSTNNGSATNNRFYDKASGQVQHQGGNSCNGNATCDGIAAWWQQEFGN